MGLLNQTKCSSVAEMHLCVYFHRKVLFWVNGKTDSLLTFLTIHSMCKTFVTAISRSLKNYFEPKMEILWHQFWLLGTYLMLLMLKERQRMQMGRQEANLLFDWFSYCVRGS